MIIVPNKSLLKPCVPVLCGEKADPEHPFLANACLMPCQDEESRACACGRFCVALSGKSEERSVSDAKGKDQNKHQHKDKHKEQSYGADAATDSPMGTPERATERPPWQNGSDHPLLVLSCHDGLPPQRRALRDRLYRRSHRSLQTMACALLKNQQASAARRRASGTSMNEASQALQEEPPFPLDHEGFRRALAEALQQEKEKSSSRAHIIGK